MLSNALAYRRLLWKIWTQCKFLTVQKARHLGEIAKKGLNIIWCGSLLLIAVIISGFMWQHSKSSCIAGFGKSPTLVILRRNWNTYPLAGHLGHIHTRSSEAFEKGWSVNQEILYPEEAFYLHDQNLYYEEKVQSSSGVKLIFWGQNMALKDIHRLND